MEKFTNEKLILIQHEGKRIKAFEELRKGLTGIRRISSLSKWNPTDALDIPMIRKVPASKSKFILTDELE